MNVEPRFYSLPGALRPERRSWLNPSAFGASRLGVRVIALNLAGLAALFVVTLQLSDVRAGLADATLQSLLVQSDAVASALAVPADGAPLIRVGLPDESERALLPPDIQPEPGTRLQRNAVELLISDLIEGTETRAVLHGLDGAQLVDSATALRSLTDVTRAPLAGPVPSAEQSSSAALWDAFAALVVAPVVVAEPPAGDPLPEVVSALGGVKTAFLRERDGDLVASVATPILGPDGTVVAALRLASAPGAVLEVARAQELAIARGFGFAALVAVLFGLAVAASVARPIRQLARAAERIQQGGAYVPMPQPSASPEIRELADALDGMTHALTSRIDAIEAFAGEVAHELKNPLTSLRSAVETLPLARNDRSRERLMDVIQHDVRRIDRLISDISDASKLDAELSRHRYERFNLIQLLRTVVNTQAELATDRGQSVTLNVRSPVQGFTVVGNDSRLGQVFTNLIDNARSFTPDGGSVTVAAERFANFIEVVVDDEGPGIGEEVMERIFERFYTDRSEQQSFGNNSGLGLAISRQIIEAHHGEIFAENRYRTTLGPERNVIGARFTVRLPVQD